MSSRQGWRPFIEESRRSWGVARTIKRLDRAVTDLQLSPRSGDVTQQIFVAGGGGSSGGGGATPTDRIFDAALLNGIIAGVNDVQFYNGGVLGGAFRSGGFQVYEGGDILMWAGSYAGSNQTGSWNAANGQISLFDDAFAQYVGIRGPVAGQADNWVIRLPADDPAAGEFLKVTSAAASVVTTEWAAGGGGVTDHGALTGLTDPDHPASAISILDTAGTFTATDVEAALAELVAERRGFAYDAIVDSANLGPAGVYATLQAAITAGAVSILFRVSTDATDITIAGGDSVSRIVGHVAQGSDIPVNIICNKADVLFDSLKFDGNRLELNGARNIAFACFFTGNVAAATVLVNNGAGITDVATSIAYDGGAAGDLIPARGFARFGDEMFSYTTGGGATSGTLTAAVTTRGRGETKNQAHADNDVITSMMRGSLTINAVDCQALACRFVACTNPQLAAVMLRVGASRARIVQCTFLVNTTYNCIAACTDTTAGEPSGVQIISNIFDANLNYSWLVEQWGADNVPNGSDQRSWSITGNLFQSYHGGALSLYGILHNISGNTFNGVTKNTQSALLNDATGISTTDATIDYDGLTGAGTLPDKGLIGITTGGVLEMIYYSSKTATQFLGCVRGMCGTTAATHADNDPIVNLSQRSMSTFIGGAAFGGAFVLVNGNGFDTTRVIHLQQTQRTGGTVWCPLNFSSNAIARSDTIYGGADFTYTGNVFNSLIIDLQAKVRQAVIGGALQSSATIVNPASDTVFDLGAGNIALIGLASLDMTADNRTKSLGRTAGDRANIAIPMTNKTGAASVVGDPVCHDTVVDYAFVKVAGATRRFAGVVVQVGVGDGSPALVAVSGVVDILCTTAAVARGDVLKLSGTAGQAVTDNAAANGEQIAKAMAAKGAGATGLVRCRISEG